ERGLAIITGEGRKVTLEADTVVLATGARPDAGLAGALKGKVSEVYLAGDCVEPRGIREAIHEGFQIAQSI
ncbi:MAG: hypothetical protein Q8O76_00955, partial [Chloroflexota bacterium]|nr:hypothetical protein [Chloroflexota bacterium]